MTFSEDSGGNEASAWDSSGTLTELLERAVVGDSTAEKEFWALAYEELSGMAHRIVARNAQGSMQTVDLVHDFFQWAKRSGALGDVTNRRHFYLRAARKMQWLMLDHYRRRKSSQDRIDHLRRIEVDRSIAEWVDQRVDEFELQNGCSLHTLQLALRRLRRNCRRRYEVVRMRVYLGLTHAQIAEALDVSKSLIEREWKLARAQLYRELRSG